MKPYGPEDMAKEAVELFDAGFHCSQAVFVTGARLLGREADSQAVIAAISPFGGGLGSSGNVCGNLTGALAAIGLTTGKTTPDGRDHKAMWKLAYKMVKHFGRITEDHGGMNCSDIARVDWKDAKAVKAFRTAPDSRRRYCKEVMAETARYLGELLQELKEEMR